MLALASLLDETAASYKAERLVVDLPVIVQPKSARCGAQREAYRLWWSREV